MGFLLPWPGNAAAQDGLEPRMVVEGLEFPSGIAFLSDGSFVVNERGGVVNLVSGGSIEKIAEIPTTTDGETGLLGAAVAPGDEDVYVFATEPDGETNTVWRVPLGGGEPTRVITGLPAAVYHNGGGVAFGGDGMLFVSNGEQHDDGRAQDPDLLGGKVYRFTPEGEVPADNPFPDSPAFGIGLRNPYGLAIDPLTGVPWVTENGPSSYDEINVVAAGSNLGWPVISGPAAVNEADASSLDGYRDPALSYEEIVVPTGIAFAESSGQGVAEGDLFFATYGEGAIHHVKLDDERKAVVSDKVILDAGEPLVAVAWGPDGLFYSTTTSVRVIEFGAPEAEGPGEPSPAAPVDAAGRGSPQADDGPSGALLVSLASAAALVVLIVFLLARRPGRRERDHSPGSG